MSVLLFSSCGFKTFFALIYKNAASILYPSPPIFSLTLASHIKRQRPGISVLSAVISVPPSLHTSHGLPILVFTTHPTLLIFYK